MLEARGIPIFYTDDEAKIEMRENASIHRELISLIGPQAVSPDHKPVKAVLSQFICQNTTNADKVNQIVHPRIRSRAQRWIDLHHDSPVIAMECALLFESGFDSLCNKTITVAAPLEVRINRICRRDNITPQQAQSWIDLQMPQEDKIKRSDFVINNDGQHNLMPQIDDILKTLDQ